MRTTPDFPYSVILEPTSHCNLRCTYCPRRFRAGDNDGYMDMALFRRLTDEVSEHKGGTLGLFLFHRGESLLHPEIAEMLRYTKGKVGNVALATNGMQLEGTLLETIADSVHFLSVSLDTKRRFAVTRIGGDYTRIVINMARFSIANARRGNPVETQVSMVRTADTSDGDVDEFVRLWEGKVDRVRVYEEHSRDGKFGSLSVERGARRPCSKVFSQMAISWDGAVRRCNHDWDGVPLGSVVGSSIAGVWNGDTYRKLREQHESRQIFPLTDAVCSSCESWYESDHEAGTGLLVTKERGGIE